MPEQDVAKGQLPLVEYQSVRNEQKARTGFRDNLPYVTLAVVAAASAQAGQTSMLLESSPSRAEHPGVQHDLDRQPDHHECFERGQHEQPPADLPAGPVHDESRKRHDAEGQ
ncbi:hypothetical protein ACWIID_37200 [Streptomyces phaeochromogenes]